MWVPGQRIFVLSSYRLPVMSIRRSIYTLSEAFVAPCHLMQLVYHNHDWEFKQVGDSTPYEAFLSQISPDLMKMELDLAWATKAKVDPVELFQKYPGRFPLWHVKDIAEDMLTLRPVGQGSIDFKRIFANAELAGLDYPFVEHDMPADGIASLKASIDYLQSAIF